MYKAKVKISLKGGGFEEVSTKWNLLILANDWIADRVNLYTRLDYVEKIETALEIV